MPERRGSATVALAMILGIIGAGFGGYFLYSEFFEQNTWYNTSYGSTFPDAPFTPKEVPLEITFSVGFNEQAYILFTCTAVLNVSAGADTSLSVSFRIDGTDVSDPQAIIDTAINAESSDQYMVYQLSLQHQAAGLSFGAHTVEVFMSAEDIGSEVRDNCLLVRVE